MTTVEEKQKELDALQAAFDEYIASSRELEEELDADFTKCQNDLAEAESRNAALSSQLAAVRPQLASLEAKASALTDRLSSETQRRVSAETNAEEAETALRRSEGALAAMRSGEVRKLREENEELCERLAFLEGEVEHGAHRRDAERERHREALAEMKGDLVALKERLAEKLAEKRGEVKSANSPVAVADHSNFGDGVDLLPPPPAGLKERRGCLVALNERLEEKKEEVELVNGHHVDDNFGEGANLPPPPPAASDGSNGGRKEYVQKLEAGLALATEQLATMQKKLLVAHRKLADLEEALASKAPERCVNGGTVSIDGATAAAGTTKKNHPHADKIKLVKNSKDAKPQRRWFPRFKFRARSKRS